MEKVDLVIVGAEGVAESGGIINKVPMCVKYTYTCLYTSHTHKHIRSLEYCVDRLYWIQNSMYVHVEGD